MSMRRTLLTRLEELCNVDVDDADFDFIKEIPLIPHNQTSNQKIITSVLNTTRNRPALIECIQRHGKGGWEEVFDRMSVHICAKNLPLISGRVLVQTSPRYLDDSEAILRQCYNFSDYFRELGVPRDRYAIKIPFTGAGAIAAAKLNHEGVRTLATSVFCLEQAIAASQSKCLLISPYFNEIAARLNPSLLPKVADVALQHPMSSRVIHILECFTELYSQSKEEQPVMVIASHSNREEIMAMAELGCQHVTISRANMKTLMTTPDNLPPVSVGKPEHPYANLATSERLKCLSGVDLLAGRSWNGTPPSLNVEYLANGGEALNAAIDRDSVARKRLTDAMNMFIGWEEKAKAIICQEAASIGISVVTRDDPSSADENSKRETGRRTHSLI